MKDINIQELKNLIRDLVLAFVAVLAFALELTGQLGIWPTVLALAAAVVT